MNKAFEPLEVYIASSARNIHGVKLLAHRIRQAGHTVLDWTLLAPPLPLSLSPAERRARLDGDEYGEVFKFCTGAVRRAALTIYYGPSGQDAAGEACMAWAAGNTVWGLAGPLEAPGTILNGAVTHWFESAEDLLAHLAPYYLRRCRVCGCTYWSPCPRWWVAPDLCSACAGEAA